MSRYRQSLPQLTGRTFLTDGGIETTLIFHEGLDLPYFAAFDLLRTEAGREALRKYFRTYADLARTYGVGLVLESATWRASEDWGARLGYSDAALADINRAAIDLLCDLRDAYDGTIVVSGCVGPRGDGYVASERMSADEAERYHSAQIATFRDSRADLVTAITMNYAEEAIGIARAAMNAAMPVVISFTVETDGNLPTGQPLEDAIAAVDEATGGAPAYYMINCAHPSHFADRLLGGSPRFERIRGFRANASVKSHAELNESPDLDEGNPAELGAQHIPILRTLPKANVLGGCCGTDHRHVEEICKTALALRNRDEESRVPGT